MIGQSQKEIEERVNNNLLGCVVLNRKGQFSLFKTTYPNKFIKFG